jgi:hypothetical protein
MLSQVRVTVGGDWIGNRVCFTLTHVVSFSLTVRGSTQSTIPQTARTESSQCAMTTPVLW